MALHKMHVYKYIFERKNIMKINTCFSQSTITINIIELDDKKKYQYAYYLYKDRTVDKKIWYGDSYSMDFTLSDNGVYYVSVFIKNIDTQKVLVINSDSMHYIVGKKPSFIPFLRIEEMEMTNYCNLNCKYCCTPSTKYPRGYINDQTVLAALSWTQKGQTLNYHRQGEPLLHKSIEKYIHWGVEAGIKPVISTNGICLSTDKMKRLYESGLRHLIITLHTNKSLQAFIEIYKWFKNEGIVFKPFSTRHQNTEGDNLFFAGKVLDDNNDIFNNQLLTDDIKKYLLLTPIHNWAGNVPGTKKALNNDEMLLHQNNCYFIRNSVVNMRWDGTIVGCCFDSENDNEIGHIRDYVSTKIDITKYNLCRYCDNNWAIENINNHN